MQAHRPGPVCRPHGTASTGSAAACTMTEVAFHFNAPDKLAYACRLLRKASASGAHLIVTGDDQMLHALDIALWQWARHEFIAHAIDGCPAAVWQRSPLLLTRNVAQTRQRQVLVNLGHGVPPAFSEFERLIEVVSTEEADRLAARPRWTYYKAQGHPLVQHALDRPRTAT